MHPIDKRLARLGMKRIPDDREWMDELLCGRDPLGIIVFEIKGMKCRVECSKWLWATAKNF